jgi:hypothetical protein
VVLSRRLTFERIDRRRRDEVAHAFQPTLVRAHERALLELGERDVLGFVRRGQIQLLRHVPGPTPEQGVAEEPDLHPIDVCEPLAGDLGGDLAPPDGLVQGESVSECQSVGAWSLWPGDTSTDALARWSVVPVSMTNRVIAISILTKVLRVARF